MKAVLALVLLLSASLAGCAAAPETAPNEVNDEGETIGPDWSFTDTNGTTHSRDSSLGSPTVLFFMATWCPTCRSNTPKLADAHAQYADQGLQVYSVSWDPTEKDSDLEAWKEKYEQPWPHGTDPGNAVAQTFGITSQSSYAVLDADGVLVERMEYPGARSVSDLEAAIDAAYDNTSAA